MAALQPNEEELAEAVEIPATYDEEDEEDIDYDESYEGAHQMDPGVRAFLIQFGKSVADQNVVEIQAAYTRTFTRQRGQILEGAAWPPADAVAPLVDNDTVFLNLYKEMYFRHETTPTLESRFESFENYCELFNYILNSPSPVPLELPPQWLWDIIDEFIYQFQSFCQYRANLADLSDEDVERLKASPHMWNVHSVLNVLHSLIEKSRIQEQLIATRDGTDVAEAAGEYGSRELYKMLGFFSIVGLLRLHCQLGDYYLALKMVENIELTRKSALMRVTACYLTAYYYISFAYMMMRRYRDAVGTLSHILFFISRTKQFHMRTYQSSTFTKQNDRMYSMLAICVSLAPQKLDEATEAALRERHADKLDRVLQGDSEAVFEEWFMHAAPKFTSPASPDYDAQPRENAAQAPLKHQCSVFMREVRQQMIIPKIRSYLRLYTTMSLAKLALLLNVEPEALVALLLRYKHKARTLHWSKGSLLDGQYAIISDLAFYISEDMINISETKQGPRYAEIFVRQINRFDDLVNTIEAASTTQADK